MGRLISELARFHIIQKIFMPATLPVLSSADQNIHPTGYPKQKQNDGSESVENESSDKPLPVCLRLYTKTSMTPLDSPTGPHQTEKPDLADEPPHQIHSYTLLFLLFLRFLYIADPPLRTSAPTRSRSLSHNNRTRSLGLILLI